MKMPTATTFRRRSIYIYGAGVHGEMVAEAAQLAGFRVLGFMDDKDAGKPTRDLPVHPANFRTGRVPIIIAIGDNAARRRIAANVLKSGRMLATVIHPSAFVSPSATLEAGVFVGPLAVVHTRARVCEGAIVNTACVVEHHCLIGAYCHLAPQSVLGGAAKIGAGTLLGMGACILPRVNVGPRCTIGAGAAVVRDVEEHQTMVGVPARPIDKR